MNILFFNNSFFFKVLGCVASRQFACLNGGVCNPSTGAYECPTVYCGSSCSLCKIF